MNTEPTDFLRVSYSSLNTFSSCPRKFEFSKLYSRRARDFDTYAADVGTSLHKGYQEYLMSRDYDKAMWALLESYPYEGAFYQEKDDRSIEAAIMTLEAMIESDDMLEWRVAEIKKPDGLVVPAIEVPFELILKGINLPDGRGIAVTGFIDALLRNVMNDRFRAWDIKTHRRTLADATAKYKFDTQQVPYGIVLEHIQGSQVDEFEVCYLDTYVDLANPRVEVYSFLKDRDAVQEWLMNTVLKCQQIQRYMEMDYFPRTDGGCLAFNRPCFYLQPCELRDKDSIQKWLLEGQAPEQTVPEEPWIRAVIDVYGES